MRIANGYIRTAPTAGGRGAHSHGTFVNGFHETWHIRHAEEAFRIRQDRPDDRQRPRRQADEALVDDEPLLRTNADLEAYERVLDFRTAGT